MVKHFILFLIGGMVYYLTEIVYRGFSHWSMFILGGICFLLIGYINIYFKWETPLWMQMGISALIITALELISGCILNLWLCLNIWDYSNLPLNLLGQICLPYTVIWFFLSVVGIVLDDVIRWLLFKEQKPKYYWRFTS